MMNQISRFDLRHVAMLVGLVVGLLGAVPTATADDDRLALTLVNGARSQGEPIAKTLREILQAEDRITYVSEDEVLETGASHGVDVETLRRGSSRARNKAEFRDMMREAGIHAILVLDVFSGTAQIVTVGPRGDEISDRRRELSGGDLPTNEAGGMLKDAFGDLIPEWKAWKKERDQQQEQGRASQSPGGSDRPDGDSGEPTPTDDGESTASSADSRSTGPDNPGTLDGGVTVWVGGIAGRHSLVANSIDGEYSIKQANPFLGGRAELSAMLGRFKDNTVGIGLKIFGSYAPFDIVLDDGESTEQLASDITQLGFDLLYMRQLSRRLQFYFGTGFEALSLRVSTNPNYTGNRYAQFRFTSGLKYEILSSLNLEVGGGLAPILESDMSGGAMGDSQFAPAILGNGAVELTAFDPVVISVKYNVYYYDLVFRTPFVTDDPVDVADTYQFGGLQFSYAF